MLADDKVEELPFGFSKLESGGIIYDSWVEPFKFAAYKMATKAMVAALCNNTAVDGRQRLEIKIEYAS